MCGSVCGCVSVCVCMNMGVCASVCLYVRVCMYMDLLCEGRWGRGACICMGCVLTVNLEWLAGCCVSKFWYRPMDTLLDKAAIIITCTRMHACAHAHTHTHTHPHTRTHAHTHTHTHTHTHSHTHTHTHTHLHTLTESYIRATGLED